MDKNKKERDMKKVLTLLMLILVTTTMLFSGGSAETSSDGTEAGGTVVYWNKETSSPTKDVVESAIRQYNEAPVNGYKIENVATVSNKYKEKLVIAMSSGQAPDVYSNWSGGPLFEYVDSGFAQPLDDLFANSPISEIVAPAGIAQATYNDHIYAIPYNNLSIAGIFYNKDIFAKYGLEEPKTLTDLENICDTLKANGIIPFALGNREKWPGLMHYICLAIRFGGVEPFTNAVNGTGSFEDESFIKAGEIIQDWIRKGYFPEGVNSLSEDNGQAKQLIYQEAAGMLLGGSWYAGTFKADSEEFYESKIGWFPFPEIEGTGIDPKIQAGTVGDQFLTINASVTGDKLEAAWALVEAHLSQETIDLGLSLSRIPPIKDVDKMLTDPLLQKIARVTLDAPVIQLWYDQYLPPAVAQVFLDVNQEVFGLTKTPQEAQAEIQAAMAEYNANRNIN